MSSKNRKHRDRNRRWSQYPARPIPNRIPLPAVGGANTSKKRGWKILAGLAACVLVAGLVVYAVLSSKSGSGTDSAHESAQQPSAPSSAAAAPRVYSGPRIQFASSVHDFGKVNGDDFADCLFLFTNTGNALLEVSEVNPSCGCMKAGQWTRQVQPGQGGSIAVRYDSHHYTGPFAKSVFVTCNDSNQPKPILEIKGYIYRPIELKPEFAGIEINSEIPSNAATIRIISHMDQPLTITNLQSDNTAFAVELQTNQPGQEYQLLVKTAPPFPTAPQQGRVTLKTTSTNVPEISINTRANLLPLVMSIPYFIRLPAPPLTNPVPSTIWVRNSSTNPITLSEPAVNAKGVDIQIKDEASITGVGPTGKQFTVSMTFPAGFEVSSGEKIELSIKTSHPKFPVLKVPVMQQPRPVSAMSPSPGQSGTGPAQPAQK